MEELFYRTELKKDEQGYFLRVPDNFVEMLEFKEKEIIGVIIKKSEKISIPIELLDVYRKHMPELKDLSNEDWSLILDMNNREKVSEKDEQEILSEFEKTFGEELVGKYKKFKEFLQKVNKEELKKDLESANK